MTQSLKDKQVLDIEDNYINDRDSATSNLHEGNDLNKTVRKSLYDYLSKKTSEANNNPPINPSNQQEGTLTDPSGLPVRFETQGFIANTTNQASHEEFTARNRASGLLRTETSDFSATDPFLSKGKTKHSPLQADGNQLLPSIVGDSSLKTDGKFSNEKDGVGGTFTDTYISNVLKHNRFNPANPITDVQTKDSVASAISLQRKFGAYDPGATATSHEALAAVGAISMLRAAGISSAQAVGLGDLFVQENKNSVADGVTAKTPLIIAAAPVQAALDGIISGIGDVGKAQGGDKIDTLSLEARQILLDVFGGEVHQPLESTFSTSRPSYGSINNPEQVFDSNSPQAMVAIGFSLLTSFRFTVKILLTSLALLTDGSSAKSETRDSGGRPFLGSYFAAAKKQTGFLSMPIPLPARMFGIIDTPFPYDQAVNRGMECFFGFSGGILGDVIAGATKGLIGGKDTIDRIKDMPTFYVIFMRNLVRSIKEIGDSFASGFSIGGLGGFLADQATGGLSTTAFPSSGGGGIQQIIRTIRQSRTIQVLNVMAQIGTVALEMESRGINVDDVLKRDPHDRFSPIDDLSETDLGMFANVMKSRRTKDGLQLAWNNTSAKSMTLLSSVAIAAGHFSLNGTLAPELAFTTSPDSIDYNDLITDAGKGRLSFDLVQKMEQELDCEYVPFYFHDLRTNEIISFHAFLTSLSDKFQVNWEDSGGFGRIDPVKIYKNTARDIGVSFLCVATSEEDFDEMWVKINKLVTMVYPQWSAGEFMSDKNQNSFVQPFSQIPTNSPIIRMRLGDLMKSNYSKFTLARLFGAGSVQTFDAKPYTSVEAETTDAASIFNRDLTRIRSGNWQKGDKAYLRPNGDPVSINFGRGYRQSLKPNPLGDALGGALSAATGGLLGGKKPAQALIITAPLRVRIVDVDDEKNLIIVKPESPDGDVGDSETKYGVNKSDLLLDYEFLRSKFDENIGVAPQQAYGNFFDAGNNSIVKAFESTAGKGLACAITSLDFDWLDNITWETEIFGSRAPKMCKITLSISPIHDIAPGLDSDGFNRAPVYNVGRRMNATTDDVYDEKSQSKNNFNDKKHTLAQATNKHNQNSGKKLKLF